MNPLTLENLQAENDHLAADGVRKDAEIEALKDAMRTILGYAKMRPADAMERIENIAKKSLKGEWQ